MASPEVGVGNAPGSGSVCIRRPPGRSSCLHLQSLDGLRELREAIGEVGDAVRLRPERVPEPDEP
eukprot:11849529-Alexandrium_andersonii.AAC.1